MQMLCSDQSDLWLWLLVPKSIKKFMSSGGRLSFRAMVTNTTSYECDLSSLITSYPAETCIFFILSLFGGCTYF